MFWALSDCPSSSKLHLIYWFGAILQIILSSQQNGKTPRASDIKHQKNNRKSTSNITTGFKFSLQSKLMI